ncbi:hypothetical protein BH10ACI1_BH10ACI1_04130 [soil metagenome]
MSDAQPIRRKGITLGVPRRLSPDELAAEEARIIEENFPKHRSLHLKPNGGMEEKGEHIEIVVTEEVLLATAHHVAQDMTKESGGFLLGNRYECPNTHRQYIVIDQLMKADYTEGTQVSLTFTTDSWAQLKDRLDGKYRGKSLVGWYHSHPAMGIFLSNYDVDIHKNRFANEWDVALVLDPVKHEGGFFTWVDGNVNPREKLDFYELLDGDSRETVVAWTNYTAQDPKTGVAAALKAVNTQNSDGIPAVVSNTPKAQTAAASSGLLSNPYLLIGGAAVLAILFLGTVFAGYWLYSKKFGNPTNTSTVENPTVNNKVLNGEKIRLGKDLKGYVSSNNKMTVEMQITGIGGVDVMEEIRKDNNLQIEINGQPSTIEETQIINGVALKVRAASALTAEQFDAFNNDKPQDFAMNVDIFYNGDVVSKKIETKFQKGKGTNPKPELGNLVAFGNVIEKNVAPKKITPKSVVTDSSTDQPKQEDSSDKTQTKPKTTTSKETKNKDQKNPNEKESLEQRANTAATKTRERISNTAQKANNKAKEVIQ